jgi:hypothetical protein
MHKRFMGKSKTNPANPADLFERQRTIEVTGDQFLRVCEQARAGELIIRSITVAGHGVYKLAVTITNAPAPPGCAGAQARSIVFQA